jgi:hypothetical protein
MAQSLTNGYDVVIVLNERELRRSVRQRFIETKGQSGLPTELQLDIDSSVFGVAATLAARLGLPNAHLAPTRATIDGVTIPIESHPNAIEIKVPLIDSALLTENVSIGGLNFALSLIFDLVRVPKNGGEPLGVDPQSLVVWFDPSTEDQDAIAHDATTREKFTLVLPRGDTAAWIDFEHNLAESLKGESFIADLASAIPGLDASDCIVIDSAPTSVASFDTAAALQCFDFEIIRDTNGQTSLAIKGMLGQPAVSTAIGTPADPLPRPSAVRSSRVVTIVSNDFLLNEALPRALMAALLDPLLSKREGQIEDEVASDTSIAPADGDDEIVLRTDDMRQQVAEENFSLRPFNMLQSVSRNFNLPLKSEDNAAVDDTFISRARISLVPDPRIPEAMHSRPAFM